MVQKRNFLANDSKHIDTALNVKPNKEYFRVIILCLHQEHRHCTADRPNDSVAELLAFLYENTCTRLWPFNPLLHRCRSSRRKHVVHLCFYHPCALASFPLISLSLCLSRSSFLEATHTILLYSNHVCLQKLLLWNTLYLSGNKIQFFTFFFPKYQLIATELSGMSIISIKK